jgi:hypothetical protein
MVLSLTNLLTARLSSFLGQPSDVRRKACLIPLLALCFLALSTVGRAQTTASISGTVEDKQAAVIPSATVTLANQATGEKREVLTNETGLYAFPSLVPGTYSITASAKGFTPKSITAIELHSGDRRSMPAFMLEIGSETQTVSVEAYSEIIPVENGQRSAVLDVNAINDLALVGRDTTELLKVLPGATSVSSGLTNGASFSDINIGVQSSAIGTGININGAVNRGGTALLSDGASIIDPGNMASSLSVINPNMTQEISVQASNFGADVANGPVVVSAISKSGGERLHGQIYFDARNNVLNANNWQDNHNNVKQGPASYYYPGANIGGTVPYTHKKLFFWGGFESWRQNLGNANHLQSYIPTPEMMAGNFSSDNANNQALCPNGFSASATGTYCYDITTANSTFLPDGTQPTKVAGATGGKISSAFLDPGAAALARIWPKANADPTTTTNRYNYYQPIPGRNDGWIYRVRGDYNLNDTTKLYISYQQAHNSQLAQGNGAHLYWTPGNAIPYPGGGVQQVFDGKVLSGHLVHNFGSTATNDLMAAWSWGSFPFTEPDPNAASRQTLQYPVSYGKVFNTPSKNIPAYSSAGNFTFPDFSQASIFENPVGRYAVRKAAPQFSDTFTKIWGAHTVKLGGYTQNTDNFQSTFATYQNGNLSNWGGQNPNIFGGAPIGSLSNPTANFVMGVAHTYSENDSSPIADTAQQTTAFFADDTWKFNHRLTLNYGARVEHVSHWYDRQGTGMAVFIPSLVQTDWQAGMYAPGFRWHGIDPGVPLSGAPNRLAFVSPRFGVSYDVTGKGNIIVRGGWGTYRWITQVNDVANALVTAQHVRGYSLPGGTNVQLKDIGKLALPKTCIPTKPKDCTSSSQWGFDPNDYSSPQTHAYNLTIDFRMPWHTQLDVAYVGSSTTHIPDASQGIEGSTFSAVADQNKTPIGAFFKPDPLTGTISPNPENIQKNLDGTSTGNVAADYHPMGYAYGTNSVYMVQGVSHANYNGLQLIWAKSTGKLTYNLNGTWSKTLGTGLQANPFDINKNYGPVATDRPFVFNASYTYNVGAIHTGNNILNYVGSGWSISGISTWQAGGYLPALLGNGVPNFGLSESYQNVPTSNPAYAGVTTAIGSATYFGTDATLPILPKLTCDPRSGVASNQRIKSSCFAAPAVGSQGGDAYPYMSMGAYFNNDLAIFKSFPVFHEQNVQIRASAANWLNHPLMQFSGQNQVNLYYYVDYMSKAITVNQGPNATRPNFGVMDTKTGNPNQRIITLSVKYNF